MAATFIVLSGCTATGPPTDNSNVGDEPAPAIVDPSSTITVAVTGNGTIEQRSNDTTTTFEAIPDDGWAFDRWTGDAQSGENPLAVDIGSITQLGAVFVREEADPIDPPDDDPPVEPDNCPDDPDKTEPGECGCGMADADSDGDSLLDCDDNCPALANAEQEDYDGDEVGDACDPDVDGDGVGNEPDRCSESLSNAVVDTFGCADAQVDRDGDGSCDPDAPAAGPGQCEGTDNCPTLPNPEQSDGDGDGLGDDCDDDHDNDTVANDTDMCPETPADEAVDADGCADSQVDTDGDGVCNADSGPAGPGGCTGVDNCPDVPNPQQIDLDGDGVGDECDPALDIDGDGLVLEDDDCPNTAQGAAVDTFGCSDAQVDFDGDGWCNPQAQSAGPSACTGHDNCAFIANDQADVDGDAIGDACDPPECGNGVVEAGEMCDPPVCNVCDQVCQSLATTGTPTWTSIAGIPTDTAWSGVWGSGPEDVFIVGGSVTAGAAYHYDGTTWSAMNVPADVGFLVWAFGFGPDDVYAVGEGGAFIHYDGNADGKWTELSSGTTTYLWGIWGSSPADMWIVGGDAFDGDPVLLHYDGVGIVTPEPIPTHDRENVHALFKVWGIGASVYAVGQDSLILQYDENAWSQAPGVPNDVDDSLIALWGSSEDDIVVVGGQASDGLVLHYNGTSWSSTSVADAFGLNAVYATATEVIIGGTVFGFTGAFEDYVGKFDTNALSATAEVSMAGQPIHAIWSDCTGRFYAVGYNLQRTAGAALIRELAP